MLDPWFEATMLAIEAQQVIGLRLIKLARGGTNAHSEAQRMVSEKLSAGFDATQTLMAGGTPAEVIDRCRKVVAANAERLSQG